MKYQKQKGYQTKLHDFLYQEGNAKNFEKTCIPCRLYHLVNITGKNLTTVSFPKVFTEVRSLRSVKSLFHHFLSSVETAVKKIGYNKRIQKLSWKMSKTLQHLRDVLRK